MARNILKRIFIGLALSSSILVGFRTFGDAELNQNLPQSETAVNLSSSRMTYGRFLEYLDMGWVKQVDLYDSSRTAIVQASSPELGNRFQSIRVEIPVGSSQLIQKLKEANINFVESLSLIQEYRLLDDSTWFLSKDKFVADLSPVGKGSPGFIGRKTTTYRNEDISPFWNFMTFFFPFVSSC